MLVILCYFKSAKIAEMRLVLLVRHAFSLYKIFANKTETKENLPAWIEGLKRWPGVMELMQKAKRIGFIFYLPKIPISFVLFDLETERIEIWDPAMFWDHPPYEKELYQVAHEKIGPKRKWSIRLFPAVAPFSTLPCPVLDMTLLLLALRATGVETDLMVYTDMFAQDSAAEMIYTAKTLNMKP